MRRPLSWVGLAIMVMAVFAGFVPTLPSILMLFATTLMGGYYIKKNAPEDYDGFLSFFGKGVAIINMVAVGLIMMSDLPYIQKSGSAFLHMMVIFIIFTLFKIKKDDKQG